jgi:8-oxo-dGTP diphosphatase
MPTSRDPVDQVHPPRPCLSVAAALIFRSGKLLITQRKVGTHLGGLWEFPGGKCEPTESFEDCLRRELREELAIEVVILELIESLTHEYPEKTVHLRFFRCRWLRNEPQPLGCAAFRWIEAAQLQDHSFPAADARLLGLLQTRIDWWGEPR